MSFKEIARLVLAAAPFRNVLTQIGKNEAGRKSLNWLANNRGVFSTFEEGWEAARQVLPAGHEHPAEIAVHLEMSKTLRPSDYNVLYWLLRIGDRGLEIFDYGGNIGNLYYSYLPYLNGVEKLDWTVFDIPSVIAEGEKLARERNAAGLKFTSSPAENKNLQVLLVSGAFHYWEKSVAEFLRQFADRPEHIFINRTPLHETLGPFVTVQRTQACAFPCMVHNAKELIAAFAAEGYVLMDRWQTWELSLKLPLFPNETVPFYSGLYLKYDKR